MEKKLQKMVMKVSPMFSRVMLSDDQILFDRICLLVFLKMQMWWICAYVGEACPTGQATQGFCQCPSMFHKYIFQYVTHHQKRCPEQIMAGTEMFLALKSFYENTILYHQLFATLLQESSPQIEGVYGQFYLVLEANMTGKNNSHKLVNLIFAKIKVNVEILWCFASAMALPTLPWISAGRVAPAPDDRIVSNSLC